MPASPHPIILVVDDNEMNRYAMSRYLARNGWEVWEASTGREGLELAQKRPNVIIVDVNLPDMIGYEVCRALKNDPATHGIPVLNTSASYIKNDDIVFGLEQGADAYLTEPIDPRELVATVKALIRLRSAEAKAEVNLAKLEAVFNSMVEGVITADSSGNFLTMNPAALQIHGFATTDEMPKTLEDQERLIERCNLDGSPLPREEWPIVRALRGEIVTNFEMLVRRRDTGKTWFGSYNATPVFTSELQHEAVIITFFDITDRKKSEAALAEAQAKLRSHAGDLEQKVAERTASLREAIIQMEEFSYTVSHDLRAPLRSIKGYAEVLLDDYAHKLKGEGAKFLERIVENGNRMERLVNDVLTISRISNTKLNLERVDLYTLIGAIVREYANLQPSSATITIDAIPAVVGHESLCIQVFSNLLTNSAKFVAQDVTPKIHVSAETRGEIVRVSVQDNGIGISPEFHQRIFGMFERLDPQNRFGGTGIGLAIVRRAVEKMNGRVGVESDGRSGSTFWVELPAATEGK